MWRTSWHRCLHADHWCLHRATTLCIEHSVHQFVPPPWATPGGFQAASVGRSASSSMHDVCLCATLNAVRLCDQVSDLKRQLIKFDVHAELVLAEEAARAASASGTQIITFVKFGVRDLPTRFADVTTRRHRPKHEHPV